MSKKRLYITRTLKILSLALAIVLSVEFLQHFFLCHQDNNKEMLDGFYIEDKNTIDVAFIGASEVFSDYSPALAYEKYGYTSYAFASGGAPISVYKAAVREILRTQNPQLIVIEVNGALYRDESELEDDAKIRKCIDNIPLNANKIDYVSENIASENQLEYYFPIVKYHSVWNDYPEPMKWVRSDFDQHFRGYNYLKGVRTKATTLDTSKIKPLNSTLRADGKTAELNKEAEKELRKFLQFCKDEKLDNIIFTRFPHIVTKKNNYARFKRGNKIGSIINEYGFDYYNFERNFEDIGLDINTDYYNIEHLNLYGLQKMTDFFANFLVENFGINGDNHTAETKEEWDNCVEFFHKYEKYIEDAAKADKSNETLNYNPDNHLKGEKNPHKDSKNPSKSDAPGENYNVVREIQNNY